MFIDQLLIFEQKLCDRPKQNMVDISEKYGGEKTLGELLIIIVANHPHLGQVTDLHRIV